MGGRGGLLGNYTDARLCMEEAADPLHVRRDALFTAAGREVDPGGARLIPPGTELDAFGPWGAPLERMDTEIEAVVAYLANFDPGREASGARGGDGEAPRAGPGENSPGDAPRP